MKKLIITLFILIFSSIHLPSTSKASMEVIGFITQDVGQVITEGLRGIETATKGKKLQKFFSGNTIRLSIDGKIKEYRFNEKKYEVFEDGKLIESGKWKVSGLLKNQIKLSADEKSKAYYFKKISKKEILYHYDKLPGKEGVIKTLVTIQPLIEKEETKREETKVVKKKEGPKLEETKSFELISSAGTNELSNHLYDIRCKDHVAKFRYLVDTQKKVVKVLWTLKNKKEQFELNDLLEIDTDKIIYQGRGEYKTHKWQFNYGGDGEEFRFEPNYKSLGTCNVNVISKPKKQKLKKNSEDNKIVKKKEEPKAEEVKVVKKKEEPKAEEVKVVKKKEEPKVVTKKEEKVPAGKKRIYKYICDPNKAEYYWGKTKDNMKLSRYEDAPYEKYQSSRGYGQLEGTGMLWSVTEIDFYGGYIYESGTMQYDANSNGKLDTLPLASRWKIKSSDKSQNIYITESEYNIPNEIVMEVKYAKNSLESILENVWLAQMGVGPKYWEKYINQCIQTEYFVDKNSGEKLIEVYSKQKPIAKKAERNLYASDVQDMFQAQTNSLFEEVNQQILKEMDMVENQIKGMSKKINKDKNLKTESQKFINEVSKEQLKVYKATSMITYFFFESQANYLASLELLYRAYDKNVEADKMKAQISYLKDSKSSENKRLKSTTQIINQASQNLMKEINNEDIKLTDESKVFYQKSLPYVFKASEYGYKVFVVSSTVGKNIANSNDKIGSILSNFNEIIGFASIIPKIPSYVKTVGSTAKLVFSGAKTKKIKDEGNLSEALDELDLSA